MKSSMQYILLFGGTMIVSTILVAALLMFKPELFRSGKQAGHPKEAAADTVHRADTTRHDRQLAGPSLAELTAGANRDATAKEKSVQKEDLTQSRDSLQGLSDERKKTESLNQQTPPVPLAKVATAADSAKAKHQKNMAKVLEAMPPESAARILQDLSDEEMKAIIMNIKKRQAAKILTAIEPSRASKLLR